MHIVSIQVDFTSVFPAPDQADWICIDGICPGMLICAHTAHNAYQKLLPIAMRNILDLTNLNGQLDLLQSYRI